MFPFNAWLQAQLDNYRQQLRNTTMEFYLAESSLERDDSEISELRRYYLTGMHMAELSQQQGDENRYLFSLIKLHQRLIHEINNIGRDHLFRVQSYYFARQTLRCICVQFNLMGHWDKATAFQADFMQQVAFIPLCRAWSRTDLPGHKPNRS
ncbi:hypothetical protein Dpoa2040_001044 [Dickeya sp. CFBP 2040]|uniref:hypothetical protein n=1 Tax=Dickeya sp. CFBP 2040 TaxID=2718531 RepID=UPI0014483422|nr:hypothetical protein [Dickeya sp. CFBP 2040]NKI73816.1 hypothetical protein [Dickeya sp. CFBP 2040]